MLKPSSIFPGDVKKFLVSLESFIRICRVSFYCLDNIRGEVRRFGVSIWVCEWDDGKTTFCKYDPSDAYFAWKALKEFYFLKTFLEKKGLF
ncbi:proteasome subunit alpha type-2-like isoform X1 [Rhodnius prolixus]|uniref:proteasome subunit alpha type-2-like isoform X1 n=1 Tax=Rhodnius prolixus TaxID=13249 RepID=UPI003D18D636